MVSLAHLLGLRFAFCCWCLDGLQAVGLLIGVVCFLFVLAAIGALLGGLCCCAWLVFTCVSYYMFA